MTNFILTLAIVGMWLGIGTMTNINLAKHTVRSFRVQYNLMWVMLILVLIERVIDAYLLM